MDQQGRRSAPGEQVAPAAQPFPDDLAHLSPEEWAYLDDQAKRFEKAWDDVDDPAAGVDLSLFLPPSGHKLRAVVLYELVKIDLEQRADAGQPTSLDFYLGKYPELGSARNVSPSLIVCELRVLRKGNAPASLDSYRKRFPAQFSEIEKIAHKEKLAAPKADAFFLGLGANVVLGGHYTLVRRLGSGSFGEVWEAIDERGDIPKAIKIIFRPIDTADAEQERQSLELIKRLDHPFLLRTEAFWSEQSRLIIVLQLASESLRDRLRTCQNKGLRGIPVQELLCYFRDTSQALDFLHSQHVVHRDIKPENILLVSGRARVADFGLAKVLSPMSSSATLAGTAPYMPPEAWDEKVNVQSDQYSFAATYAHLRQGTLPFEGHSLIELMQGHLNRSPHLDLPEPERSVVLKALAKDPSKRFASCEAFYQELEHAVKSALAIEALATPMCPDENERSGLLQTALPATPTRPDGASQQHRETQGVVVTDRPTDLPCASSNETIVPDASVSAQSPAERSTDTFPPRPRLPGYRILEELGEGAMGKVYLAQQVQLGRTVAIKVIQQSERASPDDIERFRREATAMAQLKHPNIVQVYERGEHAGIHFIAMEYVEGGSLEKKLKERPKGKPLVPSEINDAVSLMKSLALAVDSAHQQDVIHRDLKPGNILLTKKGEPKIADFGLAKRLNMPEMTQRGELLGTPYYMAPEQAEGNIGAIGPATDVHALGAIFYQLLTGQVPFPGKKVAEVLEKVRHDTPAPPRKIQPSIPEKIERIALKCLEKTPSGRYASAADLAKELDDALPKPQAPRFLKAWLIAAAACIGLIVVGAELAAVANRELDTRVDNYCQGNHFEDAVAAINEGSFWTWPFRVEARNDVADKWLAHAETFLAGERPDYEKAIDVAKKALEVFAEHPRAQAVVQQAEAARDVHAAIAKFQFPEAIARVDQSLKDSALGRGLRKDILDNWLKRSKAESDPLRQRHSANALLIHFSKDDPVLSLRKLTLDSIGQKLRGLLARDDRTLSKFTGRLMSELADDAEARTLCQSVAHDIVRSEICDLCEFELIDDAFKVVDERGKVKLLAPEDYASLKKTVDAIAVHMPRINVRRERALELAKGKLTDKRDAVRALQSLLRSDPADFQVCSALAKLGSEGLLDIDAIEPLRKPRERWSADEQKEIGVLLRKAVARHIETITRKGCPTGDELDKRQRWCDEGDPNDPWVRVCRAECLLERGQAATDIAGLETLGSLGLYVQARALAAKDMGQAADTLTKALADGVAERDTVSQCPERSGKACKLLEQAARSLPRKNEKSRLYQTRGDAELAYVWLKNAADLRGDDPQPFDMRVDFALAALCKPQPDASPVKETLVTPGKLPLSLDLLRARSYAELLPVLARQQDKMGLLDQYLQPAIELLEGKESAKLDPASSSQVARLHAGAGWLLRAYPKLPWKFAGEPGDIKRRVLYFYDRAVSLDDKRPEYWIGKAASEAEIGEPDWTRLEGYGKKAIELNPDFTAGHSWLAGVYFEQARRDLDDVQKLKHLQEARKESDEALKGPRDNSDVLLGRSAIALELGTCLHIKGDSGGGKMIEEALDYANRADKIEGTSKEAVLFARGSAQEALASLLGRKKEYETAADTFHQLAGLNKNSQAAWLACGRCKYKVALQAGVSKPEQWLNEALDALSKGASTGEPQTEAAAECYLWIGHIERERGRSADAKKAYERTAKFGQTHNSPSFKVMGYSALIELALRETAQAKEYDKVIQWAQETRKHGAVLRELAQYYDPGQTGDYLMQTALLEARAHRGKGKHDLALQAFEQGLQDASDSPRVTVQRVRLLSEKLRLCWSGTGKSKIKLPPFSTIVDDAEQVARHLQLFADNRDKSEAMYNVVMARRVAIRDNDFKAELNNVPAFHLKTIKHLKDSLSFQPTIAKKSYVNRQIAAEYLDLMKISPSRVEEYRGLAIAALDEASKNAPPDQESGIRKSRKEITEYGK